jgi:hypothetical protein
MSTDDSTRRRRVPRPSTAIAFLALFVAFGGTAAAAFDVSCTLGPPSGIPWDLQGATLGAHGAQTLTLSTVATFASAQDVVVRCTANSGAGGAYNANVIAMKTTTLHGSTPADTV